MTTYDKIPVDRIVYGIVLNDLSQVMQNDIFLSGWVLSKATLDEISECRKLLNKYGAIGYIDQPRQELSITRSGSGLSLDPITDMSKWRYSVIRPTSQTELNGDQLAEALLLSDANICVELWCAKKSSASDGPDQSIGGSPLHCAQYLFKAPLDECLFNFDESHLMDVVSLRAKFSDATYPSIIKAFQMFRVLDIIPSSPMKMLGYFSVVESLLSHAPTANDSADSISRQLKRNLILLNNRMCSGRTLDFDVFENTDPEKVISMLYAYRSAIAHGGDIQSKIKSLTDKLINGKNVNLSLWIEAYLRQMVKRVLVQALREPQLVIDLKG